MENAVVHNPWPEHGIRQLASRRDAAERLRRLGVIHRADGITTVPSPCEGFALGQDTLRGLIAGIQPEDVLIAQCTLAPVTF